MILPMAEPTELGFSPDRLARADDLVRSGVEDGIYPGAAWVVARHGWVAGIGAAGCLGGNGTPRATADALYDLASLTKPLATAACALALAERGVLHLREDVCALLPDMALPHLSGVTLAHLLTHTSGLPAWRKLYGEGIGREEALRQLLLTPLEAPPGARYTYSDLSYMIAAHVLERVSGAALDSLARELVFAPLGMDATGFWRAEGEAMRFTGGVSIAPEEVSERVAATANCPMRGGPLVAQVHDGNAWAMGGVSGHAGLFGTAMDVATYVTALVGGGGCLGRRCFSPAGARLATTNWLSPDVGGHSIGWFTPPNAMHLGTDLFGPRAFSHSGFTGTSALGDPETGVVAVLLTNAVFFGGNRVLKLRRLFHNAVAASLVG